METAETHFRARAFGQVAEHAKEVRECVTHLGALTAALLADDQDRIAELSQGVSELKHEADRILTDTCAVTSRSYILSVRCADLERFLACQGGIANSVEDFAVVLTLRKTEMHPELRDSFSALIDHVVCACEHLLGTAERLPILAEVCFEGPEAKKAAEELETAFAASQQAQQCQRQFTRHSYTLEEHLDPVTLSFYDKYGNALMKIANCARRASERLRATIGTS